MTDTPNLASPYLLAAQSQKHVTHNDAIRALDAVVQIAVLDRNLATPPVTPADGERYIVAAAPTGAWAGKTGKIAAYQDGAWMFYSPKEGWLAWVADENIEVVYDGAAWMTLSGGSGGVTDHGALTGLSDDDHPQYLNNARGDARYTPLNPLTLGINATADATNKLAVGSAASLFSHPGSGGHQIKINKAAATDTASFLFQTAFSGRAELGTTGDDKFHFKVSADGATWVEAMVVDSGGNVGIGTATPLRQFHLSAVGQPAFAFSQASGAAGNKTAGFIYDAGVALTKPGLVYQHLSDTGVFVANRLTLFRDGSVNFGGVAAPPGVGDVVVTSGNLGAGTASPTAKLHVGGTAGVDGIKFPDGTLQTTAAPGAQPTVQTFTASGTWTKPTGCKRVRVRVVGGGGGGGGATAAASAASAGAGGGAGAYGEGIYDVTATASVAVTVGAAGAAGAAANGTGGAGGTTSFGALLSAPGGSGGIGMTSGTAAAYALGGAAGLVATGGATNAQGVGGGNAERVSGTLAIGGGGAPGPFGGGQRGSTAAAAGASTTAPGSGGSGAVSTSATGFAGGAGSAGIVIVEEFY